MALGRKALPRTDHLMCALPHIAGSADAGRESFKRPFTALRDRRGLQESRPFGTMGPLIDEWTVGSAAVVMRSTGTQAE